MAIDYTMLENKYRLPTGLLAAVRQAESGGDPNAVSSKGAQGAFQFMPDTAQAYGVDPHDENQAAEGAAKMFSDLQRQYSGDVPKMLAGYNWGSGNIARHGMEQMPEETRNYIGKVQGLMNQPTQLSGGMGQDTLAGGSNVMPALTFDDLPKDPGHAAAPAALTFDDLPKAQPAAPAAPATPEMGDLERKSLLGAKAITKGGISALTGLPDLAVSAPILARNLLSNDHKWNDQLFPITNKAFELAGQARDAVGIPNVQPKTPGEKLASNIAEFGTGALGGGGLARSAAKLAPEIAPTVARFLPGLAAKLENPVENFPRMFSDVATQQAATARAAEMPGRVAPALEQMKPALAQLASGAGAGTGVTLVQQYAPDSPLAAVAAALLGAHAGTTAGKMAVAPVATPTNALRNVKLEPQFSSGEAFTLPPNTKTVDRAAGIFQKYAGDFNDRNAAVSGIEEAQKLYPEGAVTPATGVMSDNAGLLQLEKGMRTSRDPKLSSAFINLDRDLAQQNVKDFQQLAPTETGNKQATADTILKQTDDVKAQAASKVSAAEQKLIDEQRTADELLNNAKTAQQGRSVVKANAIDEAQQAADAQKSANKATAQELSVTPRLDREAAGTSLVNDVLAPAKQAQADKYKQMIAPFENDRRPVIDTSSIVNDLGPLERYKRVFGESSAYKGLIDHIIAFKPKDAGANVPAELGAAGEAEGTKMLAKTSPAELLATEQDINRAMRQAKASNDGNALSALGHAKGLVGNLLDNAVPSDMADQYKSARAFYKENVAEPFTQGTTGDVLAAGKKGEKFKDPIAESIPEYFQKGAKAGASMDQLLKAGGKDKVTPLVRDYVVDDLFKQHYNPQTNEFNTKAMRKYITDRPEAFDRVPEVRTELHQMLNKLDAGTSLADQADNAVSTAKSDARSSAVAGSKYVAQKAQALNDSVSLMKQKVAATRREADDAIKTEERSAAKFYLDNSEPQVAVERVFGDKGNLTKNLTELKNRVDKDPSGKAAAGLKEAIYDHLEKQVSSGNEALARGEPALDFRKTSKTTKDYQDALVKSGLYSADDLKVLDTVNKRMGVTQRGNLRVTSGSDTVEKGSMSDTQRVIARSSLRAAFGGFEGGNKYSILHDTLDLLTGADKKAKAVAAVMQRAQFDPELGKLLLKRDLSRYDESVYRTKINRIISSRNALVSADTSQDNNN